ILPGIVALFERNEIIGMSSIVAEISDEGHLVRGLGVLPSESEHADRGEHQRNGKLPAAMHRLRLPSFPSGVPNWVIPCDRPRLHSCMIVRSTRVAATAIELSQFQYTKFRLLTRRLAFWGASRWA